ncbi:hypothetical protein SAMD00019534_030360 [Acytostelium subglobosum LB1]|uniref:hypothetical protein n=1 Tax=Acytostelium subglobosum LB1 TaxID=1410327 RepID=UPI000644DC54|nr:hypothetical protein SAMD00019534_030360 [Acytostelium subglobosum LB1]GAM19861.1 hypothetical protein SAMD00019534_030360 [Acytostelium subglobosum LB1]|eukprot:XP_012756623.1 hypothetical protein SAMD00019534_030360 [Acytostelium subglobosum LB1]
MCFATLYGRLDIYKLLESQQHDVDKMLQVHQPVDLTATEYEPSSDLLLLALSKGRLAMFEYLLSHETTQSMERRIGHWRQNESGGLTYVRFIDIDDWDQMISIIKLLITYIKSYNRSDGEQLTLSVLLCEPFKLVLRCQDIKLMRLAIDHVSLEFEVVRQHCEDVFRPTTDGTTELYSADQQRSDPNKLEQSLIFLIDVFKLYHLSTRHVTLDGDACCNQVLTDAGKIFIAVYRLLVTHVVLPIKSFIIKGLFMNILQPCQQDHLVAFLKLFLSLDTLDPHYRSGISIVCTYGTIEMVKIVHEMGRVPPTLQPYTPSLVVYPKDLEILEYINQTNLCSLDNMEMLTHFASMANPDLLRAYLAAHPRLLIDTTQDELDDGFDPITINDLLNRHDIDKCIAIKSILKAEFTRANQSMSIDLMFNRVDEMTLGQVQSISKDALKNSTFHPRDYLNVDPAVVRYLLLLAPSAGFDKVLTMSILKSACAFGMTDDVVRSIEHSSNSTIRLDHSIMSNLLHYSFIYDRHSLVQYLIGQCEATFSGTTWIWAGSRVDIETLDKMILLESPTGFGKERLLIGSSQSSNESLIKVILERLCTDMPRKKLGMIAMHSLAYDREDVVELFAEWMIKCPPDEPLQSQHHNIHEALISSTDKLDITMVKDYLLGEAITHKRFEAEQCIRYLLQGLTRATIDKHSCSNVYIKYLQYK